MIGLLLMMVGVLLARETLSLLVGESPPAEIMASLRSIALAEPVVARVGQAMAVHFGPEEVVLNLELFFHPDRSMSEVAAAVDRVERRIRATHPEMRYVFLGAEALSSPPGRAGNRRVARKPVGDPVDDPIRAQACRTVSIVGARPGEPAASRALDGVRAIGDDDLVGKKAVVARACARSSTVIPVRGMPLSVRCG